MFALDIIIFYHFYIKILELFSVKTSEIVDKKYLKYLSIMYDYGGGGYIILIPGK